MNRVELVLHPEAAELLDQLVVRPSHAVILSGTQGIGKSQMAQALATELLSSDVRSGNNAYYRELTPIKATITIEQIRNLLQFFQLQVPGNSRIKRVAVIADADIMGSEAQNALLKLLEEPPAGSVLLLTTSRVLGLLPTIRSRAQLVNLPDPLPEQITKYFVNQGYPREVVNRAVLRHGANLAAIGQAVTSQTEASDTDLELVKKALAGNQFERLLLVEPLSRQKEQATAFTDTLATVATASLQAAAAKGSAPSRWQNILYVTNTAQEALQANGNAKLVLTELMLGL